MDTSDTLWRKNSGDGAVQEYLNLVEAARYLGVSRMTLYKLIREEKLPTFRSELNRAVRLVRIEDLQRLRQPKRAADRPSSITRDSVRPGRHIGQSRPPAQETAGG